MSHFACLSVHVKPMLPNSQSCFPYLLSSMFSCSLLVQRSFPQTCLFVLISFSLSQSLTIISAVSSPGIFPLSLSAAISLNACMFILLFPLNVLNFSQCLAIIFPAFPLSISMSNYYFPCLSRSNYCHPCLLISNYCLPCLSKTNKRIP